ncbi:hypothetical protein [Lentzea sp. CC55]|uniref:hypothetical protein n=1 Tax=Lentzea sp. CC55 TaxID=2884909 RepID=UPI001F1BA7F1|nr:hypothetical protein [Lentzea sp. CC55]MCG8926638.1 hypothetical protein [Lentzea sp. CC55]
MSTTTTGPQLSAAAEAEHIRMAEMLWTTLRELNMANESVNRFYAGDNSHQADSHGWRVLKPYAAVQHALQVSLRELCRGDEEQVEWIHHHLCDNGEDVAYNLAAMRQEWAHREEMERVSRADSLLSAYVAAKDAEDHQADRFRYDLLHELAPLVGGDFSRSAELIAEAQQKGWWISDFLDEKRQEWARQDAKS